MSEREEEEKKNLGGDQLDSILLPFKLALDKAEDGRIGLAQRTRDGLRKRKGTIFYTFKMKSDMLGKDRGRAGGERRTDSRFRRPE